MTLKIQHENLQKEIKQAILNIKPQNVKGALSFNEFAQVLINLNYLSGL